MLIIFSGISLEMETEIIISKLGRALIVSCISVIITKGYFIIIKECTEK
jgi:hypothetical protein